MPAMPQMWHQDLNTQPHGAQETEGICSFRWRFSDSRKNRLTKSLIQAASNFRPDNNISSAGKLKMEICSSDLECVQHDHLTLKMFLCRF